MTQYIIDLTIPEIDKLVTSLGEPTYRGKQLLNWVYRKFADSFSEMTNLPHTFRDKLAIESVLHMVEPLQTFKSLDGTVKVLFRLPDRKSIESALMLYSVVEGKPRKTVCISTQVGCSIGCPFCATGQQGYERNLTPGEMIDQVIYWARFLKKESSAKGDSNNHITNIVFMGMGEPFMNYQSLFKAIQMLNSPNGFGIGARNITISTAGLVPEIRKLAMENLQLGLAISLHASDNAVRDKLVPINHKYPLEALIPACRDYLLKSGRRLSFEYTLFKDINDSREQARSLVKLLAGMNCHVNLIAANLTDSKKYLPSSSCATMAFEKELLKAGINYTLRQNRGGDIKAGCGQLCSRFIN